MAVIMRELQLLVGPLGIKYWMTQLLPQFLPPLFLCVFGDAVIPFNK